MRTVALISLFAAMLLMPDAARCEEGMTPWWKDLSFVIHRNGEPDPCGVAPFTPNSNMHISYQDDKYKIESSLTDFVAETMSDKSSCVSDKKDSSIFEFCDMGKEHTPILLDHYRLVRVKGGTLPCRWYTREGLRITSLKQLESFAKQAKESSSETCKNPDRKSSCSGNKGAELHLYAVPAGRVFMFAPAYVGEIFELDHLSQLPNAKRPVKMEVLSTNPRVFDMLNVFTEEEADALVERALSETSPSHGLKRSTTGTTENSVFTKRTSENAFDTHGETALKVKRRIFEALGFDEYWDGHDDGLQVLRYNESKAYVQHMDYLTDRSGRELYDYDSSKKGGNRFATVLLYMNEMPEGSGGETVFSETYPPDLSAEERKPEAEYLKEFRDSGDAAASGIKRGTWEETMVVTCRSRLSVRPTHGRAVLFYSQHPNGEEDKMSKHGGCPVLKGETKWAANLWVWNAPRENHRGAPMREDLIAKGYRAPKSNMPKQLQARFFNTGVDLRLNSAKLYFEAMEWGDLPPGKSLAANTFEGHRWNIRVNGKVVKKFSIGKEQDQVFTI